MDKLKLEIFEYENGYMISRFVLKNGCTQTSVEYYVAETAQKAGEIVEKLLKWLELKPSTKERQHGRS